MAYIIKRLSSIKKKIIEEAKVNFMKKKWETKKIVYI